MKCLVVSGSTQAQASLDNMGALSFLEGHFPTVWKAPGHFFNTRAHPNHFRKALLWCLVCLIFKDLWILSGLLSCSFSGWYSLPLSDYYLSYQRSVQLVDPELSENNCTHALSWPSRVMLERALSPLGAKPQPLIALKTEGSASLTCSKGRWTPGPDDTFQQGAGTVFTCSVIQTSTHFNNYRKNSAHCVYLRQTVYKNNKGNMSHYTLVNHGDIS